MPGPPAQLRLARSLGPTYDRRLIEGTSSFRSFTMNDVVEATVDTRRPVVRPRDAASLILLRGDGRNLEVLAGRRPLHVKFMPGVHVFPGCAIDPLVRIACGVEAGSDAVGLRRARCARSALR